MELDEYGTHQSIWLPTKSGTQGRGINVPERFERNDFIGGEFPQDCVVHLKECKWCTCVSTPLDLLYVTLYVPEHSSPVGAFAFLTTVGSFRKPFE